MHQNEYSWSKGLRNSGIGFGALLRPIHNYNPNYNPNYVAVEKFKAVNPQTFSTSSNQAPHGKSSNPLDNLDCKFLILFIYCCRN